MKKTAIMFLCFFLIKSSFGQKSDGLKSMEVTNIFYEYEKKDTVVASLFKNIDYLLAVIEKSNAASIGVTLNTMIGFKTSKEGFSYDKTFTIGRGVLKDGTNFVFVNEKYPIEIGPLYENKNRLILATMLNQFVKKTADGFIVVREANQPRL
jgi:hypothetical protein